MSSYVVNGQEFYHHGIKGMKWGVRRFQTKDGSLTPAGRKRYVTTAQAVRNANNAAKDARKASIAESRATDSGIGSLRRGMNKASAAGRKAYQESIAKDKAYNKQLREDKKAAKENPETERKGLSDKQKKVIKAGAAVAGTALAAYGAYRFSEYAKDKAFKQAYERGSKATLKYMKDFDTANAIANFKTRHTDDTFFKTAAQGDKMFEYMSKQDMAYAKRASRNTVAAVKTLMGKNYELTIGELLNSGVKVFVPEHF